MREQVMPPILTTSWQCPVVGECCSRNTVEPIWAPGPSYTADRNVLTWWKGSRLSHRSNFEPRSSRYWTVGKLLGAAFLWAYGVMMSLGLFYSLGTDRDPWFVLAVLMLVLLLFVVPIAGYYIRNRDEEIWCPRFATHEGKPAIHSPADNRAMPLSAMLYLMLGVGLVSFELASKDDPFEPPWILGFPGLVFLSYTLFAALGRFREDGTFLTEDGVVIRARGLRASIPWDSIAGTRTYRRFPFPFHRIAIDLHADAPREVSTTVPWWIGSPRPRRNTVFLTQVQVPGFVYYLDETNPGAWILDVKLDLTPRAELAPENAELLEEKLRQYAPSGGRQHVPEV